VIEKNTITVYTVFKENTMKKWVCSVCGYVHTGDQPPAQCPQCKVPAEKFKEQVESGAFAAEHIVGVARDADADIVKDLQAHFNGECCEVGMYLAMARVAEREGYPEISEAYKRYAYEEADHASRFAELLGEVITDSTKKNLELRIEAEFGACAGKTDIAKRAKEKGLDAIHDSVHEMARDEARHCAGFKGLLKRYF
jgi:rubrerythrin